VADLPGIEGRDYMVVVRGKHREPAS
jgi:hypothetical protein